MLQPGPEVDALDAKHPMLKYVIGTKGTTRMGAKWIITCQCGDFKVSEHESDMKQFHDNHKDCE